MRWTEHWASSVLLLSFVSIRIINTGSNVDAFVVTTKPLHKSLVFIFCHGESRVIVDNNSKLLLHIIIVAGGNQKVDDDDDDDDDDETAEIEQIQEASSSPAAARQTTKRDKKWLEQYENLKTFQSKHMAIATCHE
jgi:hypothetical protein